MNEKTTPTSEAVTSCQRPTIFQMPMKRLFSSPVFLFAAILISCRPAPATAEGSHLKIRGPFSSLAQVNIQCVECHKQQADDVRKSVHWSWRRERIVNGVTVLSSMNNDLSRFAIVAANNQKVCHKCHLSAIPGTAPSANNESATINCLICHDTTGTYGPGVQLSALVRIAQTVGRPSVRNCRACHDKECGLAPETSRSPIKDIHMQRYGFTCRKCHPGNGRHDFNRSISDSGSRQKATGCISCHGKNSHTLARLNQHSILIACQSCHIPEYGNNGPVVASWNWLLDSSAYTLYRKNNILFSGNGFIRGENIAPIYFWDDGSDTLYTRGDRILPEHTTRLQGPGPRTPASKIMPFTMHTGTQPYDKKYRYLLSPKLFGSRAPFFKGTDFNAAVIEGMRELRLPYSGQYGITTTVAFSRLNHGVVQAGEALDCLDCHGRDTRFNWHELGYEQDPWTDGRENFKVPPPAQALPASGLPPVEESVLPVGPAVPVTSPR